MSSFQARSLASHHQQQIERPLETLHVDHKGTFVGRQFRREFAIELNDVRSHDASKPNLLAPVTPLRPRRSAE